MKGVKMTRLERLNNEVGELKYHDCLKCKNKGYTYFDNNGEIQAENCECLKIRQVNHEIIKSGLGELFKEKTFENFTTKQEWQKTHKNKVLEYIANENKGWLFIFGITGSGKTHLAIATSKKLIDLGYTYAYMQFSREIQEIHLARTTFTQSIKDKGEQRFKELIEADVLYIDDFLKVDDFTLRNTKGLVFDLINQRYLENKITIITAEMTPQELEKYDGAVMGRITEKAKGYIIGTTNEDRNYRR